MLEGRAKYIKNTIIINIIIIIIYYLTHLVSRYKINFIFFFKLALWSSICLEISRRNSWYWHELSFYQNKWSGRGGGWVRQTNCIQIRNHECKIEMNTECLNVVWPQSVPTFLVLSSERSVNINDIRYSSSLKAILDTTLFWWKSSKDLWYDMRLKIRLCPKDSREFYFLELG